jgi:hypothetical protein
MPDDQPKLIPTTVTIESTLKLYGRENRLSEHFSEGTTVGITYTVPEGVTDLRDALYRQKKHLDILVATMELAKGTLGREQYDQRRKLLNRAYSQLLKEEPDGS